MNELITNLRPTKNDEGITLLRPVGRPSTAMASATMLPLSLTGGKIIAAGAGNLYSVGAEGLIGMQTLCALPGTARCAVELSPARALVMTDAGALVVDGSGDSVAAEAAAVDWPPVCIRASDRMVLSVHVPSRRLKSSSEGEALARSDAEALIADHTEAYLKLCSTAASAGVMIQPALARYRLMSADGRCLFTSPTVLLSHSSGAQCCDTTDLYTTDRSLIEGYDLTASAWALTVDCPAADSDIAGRVARLDIFVTPLFHPCDTRRKGTLSLSRGSDASQPFARVALPGREYGLSTLYAAGSRSLVAGALAHIDKLERCVASINKPLGSTASSFEVSIACSASPTDDIRRLDRAMTAATPHADYYHVMLNRPHTLIAGNCAAGGDAVLWVAPASKPYKGYSPAIFASSMGEEAWNATTIVKFDGNKGVVRSEQHGNGAPYILNPLLSYPSPDAREITIIISRSGQTYKGTFPLTADASGRCSYYISPDFKPLTLAPASPLQDVGVEEASVTAEGYIAVASTSSPLDIKGVCKSDIMINSLIGRRRSQQSWEFGRSFFIAAGASGIYLLTASADLTRLSVRCLTKQSAEAVCAGFGGDSYALAGGRLMRIDRHGALSLVSDAGGYSSLGYCPEFREVWCAHSGGTDIFHLDYGMRRSKRSDVAPRLFFSLGGRLYGRDLSSLLDIGHEVACSQPIELQCRLLSRRMRHDTGGRLQCNMLANSFEGTVSVESTGVDSRRPAAVRTAAVTGALRSPLRFPLLSRKLMGVRVTVSATVSSDFVFMSFDLDG